MKSQVSMSSDIARQIFILQFTPSVQVHSNTVLLQRQKEDST